MSRTTTLYGLSATFVYDTNARTLVLECVSQSLQAGSMALEDLTRFAQACVTTLATAYKHRDLSHQVILMC